MLYATHEKLKITYLVYLIGALAFTLIICNLIIFFSLHAFIAFHFLGLLLGSVHILRVDDLGKM